MDNVDKIKTINESDYSMKSIRSKSLLGIVVLLRANSANESLSKKWLSDQNSRRILWYLWRVVYFPYDDFVNIIILRTRMYTARTARYNTEKTS